MTSATTQFSSSVDAEAYFLVGPILGQSLAAFILPVKRLGSEKAADDAETTKRQSQHYCRCSAHPERRRRHAIEKIRMQHCVLVRVSAPVQ
jgi:hypothetical protein